jgi:hypothetical protein
MGFLVDEEHYEDGPLKWMFEGYPRDLIEFVFCFELAQ